MTELVYLIDTFSLMFQVYHAIPSMTGPKGQPTNAVFGFTRDILNIRRDKQPAYLICAMDSSGPATRNEIYDAYKANRTEIPPDLLPQIPLIVEVIKGFHIPAVHFDGWEADDVIATLTQQAVERGFEVCIVTNDKDARQLLGPQVKLYNVRKGTYFDEATLAEDWGVRPDQVIDFQSLVGDSVDNVPGVPLVGPKKAAALLQEHGTLEGVLANADKAPGAKLRENLKTFADQALMSRQLVTLHRSLPLDFDWDKARVTQPNTKLLRTMFTDLGFRRFAEEFQAAPPRTLFDTAVESKPSSHVEETTEPVPTRPDRKWETIDTLEKFEKFLAELKQQSRFCFDLETTNLDAVRADIVGWAFSWKAGQAYYVPVRGPAGQSILDAATVLAALQPLLANPQIEKINQNIKYDLLVLKRAGAQVDGIGLDPMVGHYLLDAGARSHGLDTLAESYLNHQMIPITELIGSGKQQKNMADIDVAKVSEYATEDADIALQLADRLASDMKRDSLWDLYWNLERPLISVLADMEFTGIRVDTEELARQSELVGARLEELIAKIHKLAGREFNIASPKQLAEILFGELKLPVFKKTKTGPSTTQDILEKLATMHELPASIIEHRQLAKLKGTYLDALPSMVNPETGRIHATFNQVVAATGRLSSSDPNLQNIPIRTDEGRQIRRAFIPGEAGWKLVCADYSQIELRMLAHFSGDEALRSAFRDGVDIHTAVAAEVFGISPSEVDASKRRVAKAVNFGVIYGQSPYGLSEALNISQEDAAAFINSYFSRFAGVDRYLQELLAEVARSGYARTILGRRRSITGIRDIAGRQRNLPERTAINSVIQGSAADLIKQAMINVAVRMRRENHPGRMLLQIHDELVFESPEADTAGLIAIATEEMESAFKLSVPLVVDVSVGANWLDVELVK